MRRVGDGLCEALGPAVDADEALRAAIKDALLPVIEAMQTGEQSAVDTAAAAMAAGLPSLLDRHVPKLVELYERLEPVVPAEVVAHVVALREHTTWLGTELVAAGPSFDAIGAVLDAPDGGAAEAVRVLVKLRQERCSPAT